jgi:hypothetical protein
MLDNILEIATLKMLKIAMIMIVITVKVELVLNAFNRDLKFAKTKETTVNMIFAIKTGPNNCNFLLNHLNNCFSFDATRVGMLNIHPTVACTMPNKWSRKQTIPHNHPI